MKRILYNISLFSVFLVLVFFSVSHPSAAVNIPLKPPIKILLVAGHDDEVWGAQYGKTKEADMTLALATQIYNILKKDKRFEVHITRNSAGYTKEFADYYPAQKDAIIAFEKNAKQALQNEITSGSYVLQPNPPHHSASDDVALRLYGFNKWADDNNMDAIISIHFNDYPRANAWTIGKYTGFAIYMPERQFANAFPSGQLAANIFTELEKKYHTSTFPPELGGLIPDQKLIAIGANNTLNASVRSVLVEYSYIYEKKFRTSAARAKSYQDMASLTVTGIQKYFFPK